MQTLALPNFDIKIRFKPDGKQEVFDALRKRYVTLTPEEWVRQHFIHFLIHYRNYPFGLLANEISLNVNGSHRRCDSVLFSPIDKSPKAIIEYKAPHIQITQEVFNQISAYNSVFHADYLFISNGMTHYACKMNYNTMNVTFLKNIPYYNEL